MGLFDDPNNMPRIEYAIVDEETQTMRYLAEMAMEDIKLLPDPSARKVRPGSLLAQYREHVKREHAIEAANERAEVADIEEVVLQEVSRTSVPPAGIVPGQPEALAGWGPRVDMGLYAVGEFIGRKPEGE